jgi:hypothetical protein
VLLQWLLLLLDKVLVQRKEVAANTASWSSSQPESELDFLPFHRRIADGIIEQGEPQHGLEVCPGIIEFNTG